MIISCIVLWRDVLGEFSKHRSYFPGFAKLVMGCFSVAIYIYVYTERERGGREAETARERGKRAFVRISLCLCRSEGGLRLCMSEVGR